MTSSCLGETCTFQLFQFLFVCPPAIVSILVQKLCILKLKKVLAKLLTETLNVLPSANSRLYELHELAKKHQALLKYLQVLRG